MFRGQFHHAIDAKGRVSLPVRFRDEISRFGDGRLILTNSLFDPCLHLFPLGTWEQLEQRVAKLSTNDRHIVRFRRRYISAAVECELDRAGRLLVPQHFRDYAKLERDVVWAGMGKNVEVWSEALWQRALAADSDQDEAEFLETVRGLEI